MEITQPLRECRKSCTDKDLSRPVAPSILATSDVAPLESLSTSLGAVEVRRRRGCSTRELEELQRERVASSEIASACRVALNAAEARASHGSTGRWSAIKHRCNEASSTVVESLNASPIVQTTRAGLESILVCVGNLCKIIRSVQQWTAPDSWGFSAAKTTAEELLSSVRQCLNALRAWSFDAGGTRKFTVKADAEGVLSRDVPLDICIPKVVVVQRRESQRSEGRRRQRFTQRRREPVVMDDEYCGIDEDITPAPVRSDDKPVIEEAAFEQRSARVCRRIREIDLQYGNKPNNPEVSHLLAQLGTPYDSVERAIEAVYALQQEELIEAQREEIKKL